MHRLFVGLEIPSIMWPELDDARAGVEDARWQRDDQLHLTLAFIGLASRKVMRDIEDELAAVSFRPFALRLSGVGQFGKDGGIRTLWAGVDDPEPMAVLHEKIQHRLGGLGLILDQRRFIPHVTLARFPRRARPAVDAWFGANTNLCTREEWISHFTLFSSHKTDEGRFYRREASFGPHISMDTDDTQDGLGGFGDLGGAEADGVDRTQSADWWMDGGAVPVLR